MSEDNGPSGREWQRKGATLSDKTARKEFRPAEDRVGVRRPRAEAAEDPDRRAARGAARENAAEFRVGRQGAFEIPILTPDGNMHIIQIYGSYGIPKRPERMSRSTASGSRMLKVSFSTQVPSPKRMKNPEVSNDSSPLGAIMWVDSWWSLTRSGAKIFA